MSTRNTDLLVYQQISESMADHLCDLLNAAFPTNGKPWRVVYSCSEPRPRIFVSDYDGHNFDIAADTWEGVWGRASDAFSFVSELICKIE